MADSKTTDDFNRDPSMELSPEVVLAGERALYKVLSSSFIPTGIVTAVFWAMRRVQLQERRKSENV